jgi:hypothetical protein
MKEEFEMIGFSEVNICADPNEAKDWHRRGCKQFQMTCDRSMERRHMSIGDSRLLAHLTGSRLQPQNCFASNLALRRSALHAISNELGKMVKEHPFRSFVMVTLINDGWGTFEKLPILYLGAMKDAIAQVMVRANLDGWMGIIELQTIDHSVAGWGRLITPHFHALGWYDDPAYDIEATEAAMCRSARLNSSVRARTAVISPWQDSTLYNLPAYLLKAPAVAKHAVHDRNSPGYFHYEPCTLAPVSATRLFEILSKVELSELVLCSGGGKKLRSAILACETRVRPTRFAMSDDDVERFWRRNQPKNGGGAYVPAKIIRDRHASTDPDSLRYIDIWLTQRQAGVSMARGLGF